MTAHVIEIPRAMWPGDLLNMNALRGQTRIFGRRARPWRALGADLGRETPGLPAPFLVPVRVLAEFRFPTNHRRDTGNLYPTVKALIDGLVDAGVLVDDCDGLLEGPYPVRTYPNGPLRIRLVLTPLNPADVGREHPATQGVLTT